MMKLNEVIREGLSLDDLVEAVRKRSRSYRAKLREQAEFLSSRFPEYRRTVVEEANRALQGNLVLPGTMRIPRFVGNPPKWHENPVNDEEYLWCLNRMPHWKTLLWAYLMTNEMQYARKVIDELKDWLDACPRPPLSPENFALRTVTPWRSLEVGIRMFETWPCVPEFLGDTDLLTPEMTKRYAVSLHEHAEVLAEMCPLYWPEANHNHYLMENLGLLALSCSLPELKKSGEWKKHALQELERCAQAQITEGGGQIEGCPYYHNGSVYWFCLSILIARNHNLSFPDSYYDRVQRMLSYTLHSFRPSGTVVPWGDSDAAVEMALKAALYSYLAFGLREPLLYLRKIFGKQPIIDTALRNTRHIVNLEHFFSFVETAEEPALSLPLVSWQKELKQVMIRTGWERSALSVFFACRTPIQNAHAHIDPMGFDLTALGKALVVDPGRFTYREDEDRRNFKSAAWHNVLTIEDRDPFEYVSSWKYGLQKEGRIIRVHDGPGLQAVLAEHRNYEPAVHRRMLAVIDERFVLILDQVMGLSPGSTVQIYYHLDSANVAIEDHCAFSKEDGACIAVFVTKDLVGRILKGKVSDRIDVARDSVRLRFEDADCRESVRAYATLLVPFRSPESPPRAKLLTIEGTKNNWTCKFDLEGKPYRFRWSDEDLVREFQPE